MLDLLFALLIVQCARFSKVLYSSCFCKKTIDVTEWALFGKVAWRNVPVGSKPGKLLPKGYY